MVIIPHMLAGAAIGAHSPNVWAAFCFGLISHYLLDSLPHWEYLNSIKIKKVKQALKVFIDFAIGIIIVLIVSWPLKIIIISGIIGALLPDFIEFVYHNFKIKFLRPLSSFHQKIHYYKKVTLFKGLMLQVIILAISLYFLI